MCWSKFWAPPAPNRSLLNSGHLFITPKHHSTFSQRFPSNSHKTDCTRSFLLVTITLAEVNFHRRSKNRNDGNRSKLCTNWLGIIVFLFPVTQVSIFCLAVSDSPQLEKSGEWSKSQILIFENLAAVFYQSHKCSKRWFQRMPRMPKREAVWSHFSWL